MEASPLAKKRDPTEPQIVRSQLNSILERASVGKVSQLSSKTKEKELSPIRILKDDVRTSQVSDFRLTPPLPLESRQDLP